MALLRATVKPAGADGRVVWQSGDETIAKVVDGTVTGIPKGKTAIVAISADGKHSAACDVTVVAPVVAGIKSVEKIYLGESPAACGDRARRHAQWGNHVAEQSAGDRGRGC